ncbi:uncharacterized protein LY79DRAFT_168701 [Colletotrichum navitas]|uniref:Uncharacterized protein n=1 Tax=Colletotrichum navitas TaxID=681940 RepID=A0AAD8V4L2_9PEZI|nr:uncharacterized protein LY79DRAFT_168701 [Colletotrichum navitas]KAK1594062.1 hypothetical protein LY79DRAFT_168701 [Colletotrichum navitas]
MATVSFAGSPFTGSPTNPCQHLTSKPCISLCPVLPHLPYQQRSADTNPICSIDSPLVEAAHEGRRRLKSDAITTSADSRAQFSDTWRYRYNKAASRLGARRLAAAWRVLVSPLSGCSIVRKKRRKKKSRSVSLDSINRAMTAAMTILCFLINEGTPCIFKFRLQRCDALVWLNSELLVPILSKEYARTIASNCGRPEVSRSTEGSMCSSPSSPCARWFFRYVVLQLHSHVYSDLRSERPTRETDCDQMVGQASAPKRSQDKRMRRLQNQPQHVFSCHRS